MARCVAADQCPTVVRVFEPPHRLNPGLLSQSGSDGRPTYLVQTIYSHHRTCVSSVPSLHCIYLLPYLSLHHTAAVPFPWPRLLSALAEVVRKGYGVLLPLHFRPTSALLPLILLLRTIYFRRFLGFPPVTSAIFACSPRLLPPAEVTCVLF